MRVCLRKNLHSFGQNKFLQAATCSASVQVLPGLWEQFQAPRSAGWREPILSTIEIHFASTFWFEDLSKPFIMCPEIICSAGFKSFKNLYSAESAELAAPNLYYKLAYIYSYLCISVSRKKLFIPGCDIPFIWRGSVV